MDLRTQMNLLVQLSLIDGNISDTEKAFIYDIGRCNEMVDEDIDKILHHHLRNSRHELPDMSSLSEDDKIMCLYNIIRLMKADREVYLTEIKFCENIADKLGFKKKVVGELSTKVFSDGTLNADIDYLREVTKKFKM
ncbi:MAG: TerB family tellurite resistance protein [Cyclobacteriaceae bacterium]|jgi:tRNA G37 N-methylase Trm5|nr:TerB family tellurite resistance protein [Cyclobacteriaceae bacterium]